MKKVSENMFSERQREFMREIGLSVNFAHLSDDDYITIEDAVTDYLQRHGFDKDDKPTDEGLLCEAILDQL